MPGIPEELYEMIDDAHASGDYLHYFQEDSANDSQDQVNGPRLARDLILRYGWNSTCYQILNPGFVLWFSSAGDGVVGYVERNRTRVVGGAPVCAESRLADVAAEFEADAHRDGMHVCYFGAENRLATICAGKPNYSMVRLGAQPTWDPSGWNRKVSEHPSLRAQLNRAHNKGVSVSEWEPSRVRDHPSLRRCLHEWLQTRGLPPLHFLVETDTLSQTEDRRWFVARIGSEVVGFLAASPVPRRRGRLVEQLIRGHGAVNGTSELLLDSAMRALAESDAGYVSLGLAPLSANTGGNIGKRAFWLRVLLAWIRAHGNRFYNFQGLEQFKSKFRPDRWDPVYAISNRRHFGPSTLYAIAGAFGDSSPIVLLGRGLVQSIQAEARTARRTLSLPPASRARRSVQ